MIPGLLDRLDARFTFVVGKGGVGKTTTAGALALALADRGHPTHLISTDPAHSLGDLFDQDLRVAAPTASTCSPRLELEHFDASGYARGWIERARGPLAELVERGTYLDTEDVARFLDLSLPGVDEVGAALRLAELAEAEAGRVVVDTAPTGHMLRLLDAGSVIQSWTAALRAMEEKATTVAERLTRRPVRLAAAELLDELEADIGRFEDEVLGGADFVIVTAPGRVVAAETERLREALDRKGVRMAAEVRTGAEAGDDDAENVFAAPWRPDPRGCEGVRAWGTPETARDTADVETPRRGVSTRPAAIVVGPTVDTDADPFTRDLLLFAGKGGVGKTTCAAACAAAIARDRAVALFSTDPAGSLGDVLDVPVPPEGAEIEDSLFVRQVDAEAEFERFRARYVERVEALFEAIGLDRAAALDRRVVESLWGLAPPGIDEIFALLAVLDAGEARDDARPGSDSPLLVIDSAPTGHFLRLLEMPSLALEWTHALMRVLVEYRAALRLDDTAANLLTFAKRLKALRSKLMDPDRTAAVLVTLDEPVVRAETSRLGDALRRADVPVAAVIHNRSNHIGGAAGIDDTTGPSDADGERRMIVAPHTDPPPVGTAALRDFFSRWQLAA